MSENAPTRNPDPWLVAALEQSVASLERARRLLGRAAFAAESGRASLNRPELDALQDCVALDADVADQLRNLQSRYRADFSAAAPAAGKIEEERSGTERGTKG